MLSCSGSGPAIDAVQPPSDNPVSATSLHSFRTLVYLQNVYRRVSHRVILGEDIGISQNVLVNPASVIRIQNVLTNSINPLYAQTGKYPGLVEGLYREYSYISPGTPVDQTDVNDILCTFASGGSIVQVGYLPNNPWTGGPHDDLTGLSGATFGDLINSGKAVHTAWSAALSKLATDLLYLKNHGAQTVILRPFIEPNGDWFWWGRLHPSYADFRAVWSNMVSYLSSQGCDNILFHFATANYRKGDQTSIWCNKLDVYPGADLVDLAGTDDYYEYPQFFNYDEFVNLRKPVAFSEWGPPAALAQNGSTKWNRGLATLNAFNRIAMAMVWSPEEDLYGNTGGASLISSSSIATQSDVAAAMTAISGLSNRNDIVSAVLSL